MLLNFTTGDYQGFEIPSEGTGTEMCLYVPLLVQCETLRDFLRNCSDSCTKPLQHSRKYVVYDISNHGTESRILNFRMLPPDNYTKDKAYVVRIYNETLMYFAENGACSIHSHLYEQWTPLLLRYYDDECLQTECPTTIISTIIRASTVTQDITRLSSSTTMPTSTVTVVIQEETTVMPSCSFTATTELPTISDGEHDNNHYCFYKSLTM